MTIKQKFSRTVRKSTFKLKKASPTILSVIAIGGVISTAVLSAKAMPKALKLVDEGQKDEDLSEASKTDLIAINIKYGIKPFIPAIISGLSTIVCIIGANMFNKKQIASLTSAYMILENQYKEYRKNVIELHGEKEDKKIYDSIVKANAEPISNADEKMTFSYNELDYYFESTMANVAFALSQLNYKLQYDGYATLGDFYELLGLNTSPDDYTVGWSDIDFFEGWGMVPYLQYNFYDYKNEDGMNIREIVLWCDPTQKALDAFYE